MNYSTLLQRSTDFSGYALPLYATYPDKEDRQLLLGLMQMLWDRGEANGYAEHMTTDPYPDTPVHHVLLHSAFGDHQVSNWTALVEARTIGAKLYTPDGIADHALDPGRWAVGGQTVLQPFLGIDPIPSFPYDGSALVFFDSGPIRPDGSGGIDGVNPEPLSNNAPVNPDKDDPLAHPNDGEDPHEFPRRTATGQKMKSDFYAPNGLVEKDCGTGPCYSDSWTGP